MNFACRREMTSQRREYLSGFWRINRSCLQMTPLIEILLPIDGCEARDDMHWGMGVGPGGGSGAGRTTIGQNHRAAEWFGLRRHQGEQAEEIYVDRPHVWDGPPRGCTPQVLLLSLCPEAPTPSGTSLFLPRLCLPARPSVFSPFSEPWAFLVCTTRGPLIGFAFSEWASLHLNKRQGLWWAVWPWASVCPSLGLCLLICTRKKWDKMPYEACSTSRCLALNPVLLSSVGLGTPGGQGWYRLRPLCQDP